MQPSSEFFSLQAAVAGRYSLERELGRGGMGVVFLARDVALERPVAIKLLPPALAAAAEARERFLREARTAARLSHPHIVPIHAVEERDGLVWFVMTFVDGETLGERVRRAGPLGGAEVVRLVQEVAWALGHAHAHGVVHRDVKPDNILLERGSGRAMVTDFGIAHAASVLTPTSGVGAGTPSYMSPEQGAGDRVDARSDLYSLGVTAFFAATGTLPFQATTAAAMLVQHATVPAPPLLSRRPSLPPALARAVDRCLAKEPEARPQSAEALAEALRESHALLPELAPPVRRWLREVDRAGSEIGTALTASGVSVAMVLGTGIFETGLFGNLLSAVAYWSAAALAAGLAKVRLAQLVVHTQPLVRRGYDHAAVRPALALDERARREEEEPAGGGEAAPGVNGGTVVATLAGAAGTALSIAAAYANVSNDVLTWVFGFAGTAGSIAIPTITLRRLWRDFDRGRNRWHRLLDGRMGRWLFRAASVGQSGAARPALRVGAEPTAVAVGRAADELFAALPAAQRERLGDVPALLARLQADALALRPHAAEPAGRERLAETVAALETVRLDLLRLHAGHGSLDELTRDVEAARELGARVNAELAARGEVARLLDPGRTPTPA